MDAEARADLAAMHDALDRAVMNRLPATVTPDPVVSKAADVALDASWSALHDFLSGWSKLPNQTHAEVATSLLSRPNGPAAPDVVFRTHVRIPTTSCRIRDGRIL